MWDYIATAPMNLIGKDKNNPLRIKLSFSLHFLVPWILAQGSLMLFPQAPIEPCVTLILCSFILSAKQFVNIHEEKRHVLRLAAMTMFLIYMGH